LDITGGCPGKFLPGETQCAEDICRPVWALTASLEQYSQLAMLLPFKSEQVAVERLSCRRKCTAQHAALVVVVGVSGDRYDGNRIRMTAAPLLSRNPARRESRYWPRVEIRVSIDP
jgi:hypothetical protein